MDKFISDLVDEFLRHENEPDSFQKLVDGFCGYVVNLIEERKN